MSTNTNKWSSIGEAKDFYNNWFMPAARVVAGEMYFWNGRNHVRTYRGREWFAREYSNHKLHPAVHSMMMVYRPDDYQQLLLEWPHKSETDPNRLAYTRDERAGEADRQTLTTIGKYLTRHFSHAPSDMIRDIVAEHTYGGKTEITRDMSQMIHAVIHGPSSCMTKDFNIRCDDGVRRHPYAVYDPGLGWGMAVRREGDEILGRCLVWHDSDAGLHVFVRSYKRERGERSHSGSDEAIEMWLKANGYERVSEWPDGTPLKRYDVDGGYLMPYIDGAQRNVDEDEFTINPYGHIEADNTCGTANSHQDVCPNCGERYNRDDEGGYVGRNEDEHVCQSCLDDDYTYVTGRRGNCYYVINDDAVEVDGEYYHNEYLSENSIVELANGNYAHIDNAVYIESEDAYYHIDDEAICYAEDSHQYEMTDNCWVCEATDKWYTNDEEPVEVDGKTYHPDNAPEVDDDEAEEDEEPEVEVAIFPVTIDIATSTI